MDLVYLLGQMVDNTKESILMIKKLAMGFSFGQMVEDTRVDGKKENNMAKAHT